MIAVVPPGEHLVEIREESVEGACWVSVRSGQTVELEYVASRAPGSPGLLGHIPIRGVGTTKRSWALSLGLLLVALAILPYTRLPELLGRPPRFTLLVAAMVSAALAGPWLWERRRRRKDMRLRTEAADEARLVTDAASRKPGHFLGTTPKAVPKPDYGTSGLLVAFRHRHTLTPGQEHAGNRCSWLADPRLWIDGRKRPASWATWWFELPDGHHEVEVWLPTGQDHAGPTRSPDERIAPLTVPVDIAEGDTRLLVIEVETHTTFGTATLSLVEDGSHRPVPRRTTELPLNVSHQISVTTR
ncbi:hypothetical protein AB0I28_14320 [Phytomonospora sp. NPDC050363]|uniref:hypothetical protein n=1 Tax=Phytomonospora sp. NPDC050363 TaxID=3155642 RepID=UPI0033D78D85